MKTLQNWISFFVYLFIWVFTFKLFDLYLKEKKYTDKETKRLIRNGEDRKNAEPDLRVKMIFDDGSGSCTAYLNREITEKLIGRDLNSCLEFVK